MALAEFEQEGRLGGYSGRLTTAITDDVMGALLKPEMFPSIIPANVHQLDSVEGTAASPGRRGGMGRLAEERVLNGHQATPVGRSVADSEIVANVSEKTDV